LLILTFFTPVSTLLVVVALLIRVFAVLIAVVLVVIVIVCRWRLGGDRQSLPDPLEPFGLILQQVIFGSNHRHEIHLPGLEMIR
jgi:hypothetical protein